MNGQESEFLNNSYFVVKGIPQHNDYVKNIIIHYCGVSDLQGKSSNHLGHVELAKMIRDFVCLPETDTENKCNNMESCSPVVIKS